MPDTPHASSLVEMVARALCELEVAMGDAPAVVKQAVDERWPEWEARARYSIVAVLDAIAEPSDAMGYAGLIATNGDSLKGWPDEQRRAAFEALGDIGYGDRLSGNPSKWMKPIWRAMIAELRKEIENG